MSRNYVPIFSLISPLDARYYASDPEVFAAFRPYLSEEAFIRYQVQMELAIAAELEARGIAPQGFAAAAVQAAEKVEAPEVYEEEARIQHNIRALVNCLRERLPEAHRGFVHLFATSNDITDTARTLMLRDFTREVLLANLGSLVLRLAGLAAEHAGRAQVGRTHGQHAVPVTVGYWLGNYVDRLGGRYNLIATTAAGLRGKYSGAVGARNALAVAFGSRSSEVERAVLARLGLEPSEFGAATQVVQAEPVADYMHALTSMMGVLADLADDVRHLMRSELQELVQVQSEHSVGSSTMPHKVNPKDFENVKSLWKAFHPRMVTVYQDQLSEHQRDLTNSASSRFVVETAAAACYAVRRLDAALGKMRIHEETIARNLHLAGEWTAAEPLYIGLVLSGHEAGYEDSRALSRQAREQGTSVLHLLRNDPQGQALVERIAEPYRTFVLDPEAYVGDSADRARAIAEAWSSRIPNESLLARLERPSDEAAFTVTHR